VTRTNRNTLQWFTSLLILAAVVIALTELGGVLGGLFALTTVIVWVTAPPVFAFAIAQAGVAALSTPPITLRIMAVELVVLAMVLTDTTLTITVRSHGPAICALAITTGVLWLVQPHPIWIGSLVALTGLGLLVYATHRYELFTTHQLD
jgi:hypothetical protein